MNDIWTKNWIKLNYKSPKNWLMELDKLEKEVVPRVVRTRPRLLNKWANEARQAGIFSYGMELLVGKTIGFAMNDVENSEVDFVAIFSEGDTANFVPIQLKEWVPENVNPNQSLEHIYSKLRSYSNQTDLTIAIYVCRDVNLKFEEIKLLGTQFAGVWIFGSCSQDKSKWFISGDIQQDNPEYFEFDYPMAS